MNGKIVGAAMAVAPPWPDACEEFRRLQGAGEDSDLIPGYARLREKIAAAEPDVVMIFDTLDQSTRGILSNAKSPISAGSRVP